MADPSKEEEQELSVQLKARACFVLGRSQASRESERESHSREFDSFGLSKLLLGKKKTHREQVQQVLLLGQTLQETPEKKLCVWSKGTRCQDQDLVCCQYEFIHASDHIRAGPGNGRTR